MAAPFDAGLASLSVYVNQDLAIACCLSQETSLVPYLEPAIIGGRQVIGASGSLRP
jgi:hypothetical protein